MNKSMIVMAAASGILTAVGGGYAHADASADGIAANSPGVASGNAVQVPVHIPVNVCGNTVNVIAALNPAFGNACANVDSGEGHHHEDAGASAEGRTSNSPGVLSGNLIQAPVDAPTNVCGNSVNIVGALNPAGHNDCANVSSPAHEHPPVDEPPMDEPPVDEPPADQPSVDEPPAKETPVHTPPVAAPEVNTPDMQLAHTGAEQIGLTAGASAALLLGGAVLLRRTRSSRK